MFTIEYCCICKQLNSKAIISSFVTIIFCLRIDSCSNLLNTVWA